jgi:hypothetical protein
MITKIASMIGSRTFEIVESGVELREVASSRTRTSVCIAMPPRRFPVTRLRFPWMAPETVIAISGSVPAIPSSTIPPRA